MDTNATTSFADIEAMKYNDLKSKAAELGIEASGTKEDLVARITAHLGLTKAEEGAGDEGKGDTKDEGTGAAPAAPVAPAPKAPAPQERKPAATAEKPSIEELHHSKAMRTKAALDKQRKVMVLIPFEAGEKPETAKLVPFHVGINGYSIDIPRGVMTEVPEQVAQMVRERLESEGRMGREHLVDADAKRAEALS